MRTSSYPHHGAHWGTNHLKEYGNTTACFVRGDSLGPPQLVRSGMQSKPGLPPIRTPLCRDCRLMFHIELSGSHSLFPTVSNSSLLIMSLDPGFIAMISRLPPTFNLEFSCEDFNSGPSEAFCRASDLGYASQGRSPWPSHAVEFQVRYSQTFVDRVHNIRTL